ncbi:MAG: menaquinone biosynthesis protein [Candidatus Desulfofervidaceae bacterium]|nr:menaquinone biosynthesis protein [Candidatus Desulfofervidaceae bacterium]
MALRLGKFPFLNCIPIYHALETGQVSCEVEIDFVSCFPAELNKRLQVGQLDIGPISSVAYLEMTAECLILPHLSISAPGQVKSVILFSRVPIEKLNHQSLLLTSQSATSIALLKLILTKRFGICPHYQKGELLEANGEIVAGLAIGDTALKLTAKRIYPYQLDLGKVWREWTGLPFVFGLFAVRKTVWKKQRETVKRIWQALQASKKWGLSHLNTLAQLYSQKTTKVGSHIYTSTYLCHYWQHLDYELSSLHFKSLNLFFHYLREIGEIASVPEIKVAPLED